MFTIDIPVEENIVLIQYHTFKLPVYGGGAMTAGKTPEWTELSVSLPWFT